MATSTLIEPYNDGVLCGNNVIKHITEQSMMKISIGDQIHLTVRTTSNVSQRECPLLRHNLGP